MMLESSSEFRGMEVDGIVINRRITIESGPNINLLIPALFKDVAVLAEW